MDNILSKLRALKRRERIYGIRNPLTYDFLNHNLHHLHVLLFHSADQQDFTRGAIVRQLLIFMLPILLSQLLQQFYTIADTALVGQALGAEALAAVGTASLILSVIVNFFIGFSAGLSILVSHLYGEKQYTRLSALVQSIFVTVLAFAVLFTAAGILLTEHLLAALSTPAELIPQASLYLRIALGGMLAQLLYNTASAILRALGNTTSALHYLAAAVVLNIVLDVLLLIVIPCGIAGAAAATVIAQYASALLALRKFRHLHGAWQLRLHRPFFQPAHLLPILGTSIPAGLQAVFMSISSLVIQTYINSFGYAAMAGMTVYARIEGFLYYPLFAFGIALAAGLAAPTLVTLFTDDPAVIENALDAVYYTFPFYFLYGINQIYIGALRGLGDTLYPMMTALAAYCVFRVAWCYAWDIVGIHSMHVVYNAYNVSFLVMGVLLYWGCRRALRRTDQVPTA